MSIEQVAVAGANERRHVRAWMTAEMTNDADDPLGISHNILASLHLAISSAKHPECAACRALLPVLSSYMARVSLTPPA